MKNRGKVKKIDHSELSSFCGQTALVLEAGLPLFDGLETLALTNRESPYADMYEAVAKTVTAGGSLYEALGEDERWPSYMKEMVGIGERTGQLEHVLRGLETYFDREVRIRSSVKSAVTYPLTLGIMLVIIVLIMLWKVLPVFRNVLAGTGMAADGAGGVMLRLGTIVGWTALVVVALALVCTLVTAGLMQTRHAPAIRKTLMKIFTPIRKLEEALGASRVASVLSMMLSGGFSVREALERTESVVESDLATCAKVKGIMDRMDTGESFTDALEASGIFSPMHNRMIRMGAAAAREDQVFAKIADLCEEQVQRDVGTMVSIIEPSLVGLLTVVIGAVLLSVMLPMAGMLSTL